MDEEVLRPDVTNTSRVSGRVPAQSRKASMFRRDGGRIRTAIRAWTGRPIVARSRSSRAPRMTPRSRRPRVRSSALALLT